jgi:hypothetical protein
MKQLERISTVTYRWWRDDEGEDIIPEPIEELEESAMSCIAKMQSEYYTGGELTTIVYATGEDDDLGVGYTGWWEVSTRAGEDDDEAPVDGKEHDATN